jgi:glycosyltransferase involved in cell wall biosynthesis
MSLRIAYMTGEYLRVSPFVFVYREVAALRELGVHVETFSVRGACPEELVSPEQKAEQETTHILVPCSLVKLVGAHLRLALSSPGRYAGALRLAVATRPPGLKGFLYQMAYFLEAGLLAEEMRRRRLSHLHNHFANSSCNVAMLAAELGGFTFSFTMHGPAIFFEPRHWRVDEKLKRALFVCCISHYCRSQAMIWAPPERWDRLHIVHCGVDPQGYEPVTHEGEGKRLLFVGRLAKVKGLVVLLEALAAMHARRPDLRLALIGDGPDRSRLERSAVDLGVKQQVQFLGYKSHEEVQAELRKADVFVMASFAEGVPVVLMEAMATGLPVVATRVAGVPELVDDGVSGFITPPGNPDKLAEKIEGLIADHALRTKFGRVGREKVEQEFNARREAVWLRDIMTAALEGRVMPTRPSPESRD